MNSTQLGDLPRGSCGASTPGYLLGCLLRGTLIWPGCRLSGTRRRGPEVAASPLAWQPPARTDQRPQPSLLRTRRDAHACMHACCSATSGTGRKGRPLNCDAIPTKAAPYLPTWWRSSFSCASFTSICDESCRRTKSSAAPSCSAAPATVPASATLEYSAGTRGTRGYYRGTQGMLRGYWRGTDCSAAPAAVPAQHGTSVPGPHM